VNWKIIVGALLIFGATRELFSVIADYRSGKLDFWPVGVEVGFAAMVALGVYLIRKGIKQKKLS
jgi:hypothetical protein